MFLPGGGPTGVEFAAELHDLLHEEMEQHYPNLTRLAKISLYDVAPNILGNFDSDLAEFVFLYHFPGNAIDCSVLGMQRRNSGGTGLLSRQVIMLNRLSRLVFTLAVLSER